MRRTRCMRERWERKNTPGGGNCRCKGPVAERTWQMQGPEEAGVTGVQSVGMGLENQQGPH